MVLNRWPQLIPIYENKRLIIRVRLNYLVFLLLKSDISVDLGCDAPHGVQALLHLGVHAALDRRVAQDGL